MAQNKGVPWEPLHHACSTSNSFMNDPPKEYSWLFKDKIAGDPNGTHSLTICFEALCELTISIRVRLAYACIFTSKCSLCIVKNYSCLSHVSAETEHFV